MADVTFLLNAAQADDPDTAAQLLPLVYDELRRLAALGVGHVSPPRRMSASRWERSVVRNVGIATAVAATALA
jgi:hypothetical protein